MEQFIVSARKYRPGTFESVVGQEHVTQTLKNAIRNNHLAQAFLFCGPRGVGKTTCARILAKTINCTNLKPSIEPCNECDSCVSFNKSASFNIYELDAASNNSVDDIRALVDQVRYAPQGAKYKIYIIDEVHMLSTAAFNAFLKTLEEPPSYAIFILATTERHKILPTILSRCQIFDFNRITISSMVSHLGGIAEKEQVKAESDALHIIAEKADGALRDALSIFDQMVSFSGDTLTYESVIKNLNILDYEYYFRTMDLVLEEDSAGLLMLMDEVLKKGFDPHLYLGGLCDHLRNLLICKDEQTKGLLEVAESAAARYETQSKKMSSSFLFNALQLASTYDASYKSARNTRLHVELALLKLANLNRAIQLAVAPAANANEEKKTSVSKPSAPLEEKKEKPKTTLPPEIEPVTQKTNETPLTKAPEPPKSAIPSINLNFTPGVQVKKEEDLQPQAVSAPEVQGTARVPLTADKASSIWMEFAGSMAKQKKMSLATGMQKAQLRLENRQLFAEVASKHVADYITEVKTELVAYMNSRLETELDGVYVEVVRSEQDSSAPYTLEEKLNAMVQKNPQLPDFMRELGLELDY
ncbi:MAG: DNA polymerase III subunit gamma/tau [Bacteroidota bacterium]|nr:DNA polymerase III subunit gamma/tau [Bacteroidota bacterium]MDX5431314.1 DNA polymerase III subunit gamma/tau [Bacteroidota bacterium]MDX5470052.1 DNA polymerase III subunit gamma/tau [Bacteroidota bacterium]